MLDLWSGVADARKCSLLIQNPDPGAASHSIPSPNAWIPQRPSTRHQLNTPTRLRGHGDRHQMNSRRPAGCQDTFVALTRHLPPSWPEGHYKHICSSSCQLVILEKVAYSFAAPHLIQSFLIRTQIRVCDLWHNILPQLPPKAPLLKPGSTFLVVLNTYAVSFWYARRILGLDWWTSHLPIRPVDAQRACSPSQRYQH